MLEGCTLSSEDARVIIGPVWAEVDLDAVAENVKTVRSLLAADCCLLAVVKADAYGHGASEVGRVALASGASGLGVSTLAEGLRLRADGVDAAILVFTPARAVDWAPALDAGVTLTVGDVEGAQELAAAAARRGVRARAHLKCDSGMGRYGIPAADLAAAAPQLAALADHIQWEGVYTHFSQGWSVEPTRRQLARFLSAVAAAQARGLVFAVRHAAASAAMVSVPEARLDMVRAGSVLYGDRPPGAPAALVLRRAFTLRAEPAQVRHLPAGTTVGYGAQWRARRATRTAVLPVGYADGLEMVPAGPYRRPRTLLAALAKSLLARVGLGRAPAALVEMDGRPIPILGRVGMQQTIVDCSEVARIGPATLQARPAAVGRHVARVFLRDGVALYARTVQDAVVRLPATGARPVGAPSPPEAFAADREA